MSGTVIIAEWEAVGFDVRNVNHALAVLVRDFPGPPRRAWRDLEDNQDSRH